MWSDLIANPALGRRLNYRPPEVPSNLNGFCYKLISNNIFKVCTQKSFKKKQLALGHRRVESLGSRIFQIQCTKTKPTLPHLPQ